ncbi:DUF3991 and toprim domain-containing protein [Pararhizobium sp. YC-54]|uniref:DUF3991 and toprim domain-containing protein n=1 Tax=Pararhizobium sp. YC-54 TaxID=2986920 RepID=UPI0021F7CCF5|nr:DUF3991 and toprim domain-containing protein [Pararhizobium sp. YC-54]MCW0002269.1 DUF3991 and toprim domain-containing protein [Pararhizobium sp. YC-54]
MTREEIEDLRQRVGCQAVLETSGFALDRKESTRRAVKFRRGAEIIIVTHEGRGWFDPLGDSKGDIFSLVSHLDGVEFGEGLERVAALVGFQPSRSEWRKPAKADARIGTVAERWLSRKSPAPGSGTWRYLYEERFLPASVIRKAIAHGVLREGPYCSMWAAHTDTAGAVTGWEERGSDWRGFASGGAKVLFRLGPSPAPRLCVTEAAIDAMSLAAVEGMRDGTLYLSTGGGWSPATEAALRALADQPAAQIVAATDANPQGEAYADRLRSLADELGCEWLRLRPSADDWNDVLKLWQNEKAGRRDRQETCRMPDRRVKGEASPGKAGP